ncbi:hypothetical protein [Natronomonas gomsonensis]|uniref:DUF7504 family protein n=1 Tax=Natronomonas gomsonensis TaxID=1046043 RepID=UPI0015BCDA91|nr:hypothetical protein [Natronomonas gomsonensis]
MASISEWLAGEASSYILYAPPMGGVTAFSNAVGADRADETLLVSATHGEDATPTEATASLSSVLYCTPTSDGVSTPGDLTGISMPVSEFLKRSSSPAVFIDSVTTLLYYAEDASVFRFLSVLTAHIRRNDGLGVFAMTPDAHHEQTVRTFEQLFDGRIELDADGERARVDAPGAPEGWQPR